MSVDKKVNEAQKLVSKPEESVNNDEFTPQKREVMGLLTIPDIKAELANIEGTDPDELELGDEFIVSVPTGEFTYKIGGTKIVDAADTSIITLQNQKEELIVTTCYPFGFIRDAPERYIIYAEPV